MGTTESSTTAEWKTLTTEKEKLSETLTERFRELAAILFQQGLCLLWYASQF